ncbi:nuclease-related domain-containing protein [Glaciihabitans sp. UYNi722]|uniref:nuclease-related domain-containing protein n=1 Tax=Glaciihabitans sp. UYNi722 TaxID=3156344 RepID=UPI0033913126
MEDPADVEPAIRAQQRRFTAMDDCLAQQAEAPRLSLFARLFGLDPLAQGALRSYRGARAELAVAHSLTSLGDDWTVLHSVSMEPNTPALEHLAIGPPGVFVISTKSHAAQTVWVGELMFMADDIRYPYLPIAEQQNREVAERFDLRAPVTSCMVVAAPRELTVRRHARHIEIVTAHGFEKWLRELPRLLSPQLVSTLAAEASSWPAANAQDSAGELHAFEALRRRIRRSLVTRLGWIALAIGITCGALYRAVLALMAAPA